jgi:hypothetical protein
MLLRWQNMEHLAPSHGRELRAQLRYANLMHEDLVESQKPLDLGQKPVLARHCPDPQWRHR